MNGNQHDFLETALRRCYEPLRAETPGQRVAMLEQLASPASVVVHSKARSFNRPMAWAATAASLLIAAIAVTLLLPPTRHVYGIESVPDRLAQVQTIRQRGYRLIYPGNDLDAEPIRIALEYAIRRPDRCRMTTYSITDNRREPPQVVVAEGYCSGQQMLVDFPATKERLSSQWSILEGWVQTEVRARFLVDTLFGSPDAQYKKSFSEAYRGRPCDVYEARDDDSEFDEPVVSRIWVDAQTGFPVRSTRDALRSDGTLRRLQEWEQIEVNVALDDAVFEPPLPDGYKLVETPPKPSKSPLESRYQSAGYGGNDKLEAWHALQITEHAALVVWRRSTPQAGENGAVDWLSGLKLDLYGDKRPVEHQWLYQSFSPDVWNWSLVSVRGAALPSRGGVRLVLKTKDLHSTIVVAPLRFPPQGLEKIVAAAVQATLPPEAPRFTLDDLRRRASP